MDLSSLVDSVSSSDSSSVLSTLSDLATSTVVGVAGSASTAVQNAADKALNPVAGAPSQPAPDITAKAATPSAVTKGPGSVSSGLVIGAIGLALYLFFTK